MRCAAEAADREPPLGGMGVFMVGALAMFAVMYSTQAALPEISRAFGVSPSQAGLTVSVPIGAVACGCWLWGPLSDRIGRRRSLVLASALLVVPSVALAAAPSFPVVVLLRGLQGLCMPGLLAVGVPYVAEVYQPRIGARAAGYYLLALVVGGLVGRLWFAFAIDSWGWRPAFATIAVLPLLATFVLARWLPHEPARSEPPLDPRAGAAAALRTPSLWVATVAGSALFFGFIAVFSYAGVLLESPPLSLSPSAASLVFLLWVVGLACPAAGHLAGAIGWRAVALGSLLLAAAGIALTMVPALPVVIVGLTLVTLGDFCGVTAGQIGLSEIGGVPAGAASAVYFSSYYLAGGLAGYLPGLAWEGWGWDGVSATALGVFALGVASKLIGFRGGFGAADARLRPRRIDG